MIPKIHHLTTVWDGLLDWHKRRKRDRDREFQHKVVLAADALICTAAKAFFRGVMIGVLAVALLWLLAQIGHH